MTFKETSEHILRLNGALAIGLNARKIEEIREILSNSCRNCITGMSDRHDLNIDEITNLVKMEVEQLQENIKNGMDKQQESAKHEKVQLNNAAQFLGDDSQPKKSENEMLFFDEDSFVRSKETKPEHKSNADYFLDDSVHLSKKENVVQDNAAQFKGRDVCPQKKENPFQLSEDDLKKFNEGAKKAVKESKEPKKQEPKEEQLDTSLII